MAKNYTLHRIAFYIGIILVWQIISMSGIWPDNIFPSPYDVAEDLAYGAADGSLFYGIATSMWRLSIGLAVAIVGGVVLGIFMARIEMINQTVGSPGFRIAINPVCCLGSAGHPLVWLD